MTGPVIVYFAVGLYFWFVWGGDYERSVRPSVPEAIWFMAFSIVAWPLILYWVTRSK